MVINEVPVYVKAKTPELLVKEMLKANTATGRQNKYFSISYVGTFWYAWYYNHVKFEPQEVIQKPTTKQTTVKRKTKNAVSKK